MSVAAIEAQIREVQEKIAKCQEALNYVEYVKGRVAKKTEDWESGYQPLQGDNNELKSVQKQEVFEGEMAKALKPKVGNCCEKIENSFKLANNLTKELGSLGNRLNQKIAELEKELRDLQKQLAEAIEEEQRRLAILSSSAYLK